MYSLLASIKSNNEDPKYTSRFGFMALRNGFMCDTTTYRAHQVRIYRRLSDLTHLFNSNSSPLVELEYYRDGREDLYCYGNLALDKDIGMKLFHIYGLNIETRQIAGIDRIQNDYVRHLISYCLHYNLNNTTGTKFNVKINDSQDENDLSFYLFIDGDYIYVQHYYIYRRDNQTKNLVYQVFPLPHHDGCSLNRPENVNKRLVDNTLLISQTDWVKTPFYSFFNLPKEILFALNNQILHEALLHQLPKVRYEDAQHRVCLGLIVYVSDGNINTAKKHEYRCVVISNTDLNKKQFTFETLSHHLETNFNFENISYSNTHHRFNSNSKIQNSLESLPMCELDREFIKHRLMKNLPSEFITELLGKNIVFNSNVMRGGDWNHIVLFSRISTVLNSLTPSKTALSEHPTLSEQLIQLSQELIDRIKIDYDLCVKKLEGSNRNNIETFESEYIDDLKKQLLDKIQSGQKVDKNFVDLLNNIVTLLRKFQDTNNDPFYKHFLNVRLKKNMGLINFLKYYLQYIRNTNLFSRFEEEVKTAVNMFLIEANNEKKVSSRTNNSRTRTSNSTTNNSTTRTSNSTTNNSTTNNSTTRTNNSRNRLLSARQTTEMKTGRQPLTKQTEATSNYNNIRASLEMPICNFLKMTLSASCKQFSRNINVLISNFDNEEDILQALIYHYGLDSMYFKEIYLVQN